MIRRDEDIYWLLFATTNTILGILYCMSLKQCCNVDISDKKRCHRTMSVVLFSFCALLLNTFIYLSSIYPNFSLIFHGLKLPIFTFIFEAIVTCIGFHIFCLFHISFIDGMYKAITNVPHSPLWIRYTFNALRIFVVLMILICYSSVFIFVQFYSIIIFYILYAIIILSQSILVLFESNKILKLLNRSPSNINNHINMNTNNIYNGRKSVNSDSDKLLSAKRSMKAVIFILILICIVCVVDILINLQIMRRGLNVSFDVFLWSDILRSLFMITLMMVLIFWIYRKDASWFDCVPDSVCMCLWRCTDFRNYISLEVNYDHLDIRKNDKNINLLETPTAFRNGNLLNSNTPNMIRNTTVFNNKETTMSTNSMSTGDSQSDAIDVDTNTNATKTTTLLIAESSIN